MVEEMIDRVSMPQGYDDARSELLQELLTRSETQGYVTYEDIVEVIADDIDEQTIESVLEDLEDLGVEVRPTGEEEDDPVLQVVAKLGEDEEDDDALADISAVSADDPVGLYFRQMAQEPLLTAEEEIELAKIIEAGKKARAKLEKSTNLSVQERAELVLAMERVRKVV